MQFLIAQWLHWLQLFFSRKAVADRLQYMCDRGFNRSKKGFWLSPTGCRLVADWLPTDRRPVAVVADNPDAIFSRRLIADQSPNGCRSISKKLQTFCNQKQTLKIQSPTSRRPIANWLPIASQLIADWLATDRRRVGNHCPITRQYSINTRSLSAPDQCWIYFQ